MCRLVTKTQQPLEKLTRIKSNWHGNGKGISYNYIIYPEKVAEFPIGWKKQIIEYF